MSKKNFFLFTHGFIDPLSLFMVGFLVLTIAVGTAVTNNKNISMNISKFAKMVSEESGIGKTSSTTKKTPKTSVNQEAQVGKTSPPTQTSNPTNQESESGKTSPLTPTTTPINQETQVGKTSPPTPSPTPINQESQVGKTSPPTPTPTPISLSTKTCTVNKCSGTSCVGSSITIPHDAGCPVSSCTNNTDCKTTTPTKCDCIDGIYYGTQCGSLVGKKCGKTPTPTPIPPLSTICEGKPNVCNNAGGYNYCKNETWYSQKCPTGTVCLNGECNEPTKKDIGETCSIDSECSSGNCYSGSSIMGGSPFDSIKTCRSQSISTMDTTIRDLNTRTGIAMTAELGLLAAPAIGEAALAGYSYSTAFFSTLPTSVQTAIAVGGTVAGYAGVTAGTVACTQNPYSDACVAYVAAIQGDPLAMIQLAQSADSLINASINNSINKTFSYTDMSRAPEINGVDEALSYYYGYVNPNKLSASTENQLIKALTGYDIDNSMVNTVLANDANIVRQKYNLPSAYLRKEDPLEYQAQLLQLAKDNDIDILTQNETTFFDNNMAEGVAFESQDFIKTTIAYNTTVPITSQNEVLEHEITHGIQLQQYPRSPIEIKEYEAYLVSFNPDRIEGNLTPAYLDYVAGANWMQSIDSYYSQNGLTSPTLFGFLNTP